MLLAAVDLGSNSFRLELGRAEGSHIERQGYWKETVRLAGGLDAQGRLSARAIATACECLARMNERLRGIAPAQVRAVGTQTLRTALNAEQFLLEAQNALGYPIEVIAGREEARLVFEGCMHSLPPSTCRRLVVDIGGASTELIVGRGFTADHAESYKIGCVSTTLRFFPDGRIDRVNFKRATVACAAEIEEAAATFARGQWDEAFGSSGTASAVAEILRLQGWGDGTIGADGLARLRQAVIAAGEVRRLRFEGLKSDRQEVIAGGVAVLSAVFDTLGVTTMQVARGALRVGLLYDLLGRRESRDVRDATVDRVAGRLGVDRPQAARVARIAQQLYAALRRGSDPESDKRLAWAAALHEVGFAISRNEHHKHGAYLVEHGDLAGFSTSDQLRIAQLILGQRGNLRKLGDLLTDPRRADKVLALRLAVVFCHARRDVTLPRWTLRSSRNSIDLAVDAGWLEQHPLTAYLIGEEAAHWERVEVRMTLRPL